MEDFFFHYSTDDLRAAVESRRMAVVYYSIFNVSRDRRHGENMRLEREMSGNTVPIEHNSLSRDKFPNYFVISA